jgi:hypothetical protein
MRKKSFDELLGQIPDKSNVIAVVTPAKLKTDLPQFAQFCSRSSCENRWRT